MCSATLYVYLFRPCPTARPLAFLCLHTITKRLGLDAWHLFTTQVRRRRWQFLMSSQFCGKEKVSVAETSGINNWRLLLHRSDSDLPLRAFTHLPKLFIHKARFLKRAELKTHLKRSAVPNSIQFDFNIWSWLSGSYRSFLHRLLHIGGSQGTVVRLTSSEHGS